MQNKGGIWRMGLIATGLLVFLLLFFADKTNLTNLNPTTVSGGTGAEIPQRPSLPPLAPDPKLDRQIEALASEADQTKKVRLLDTIIVSLQARNRLAFAADYAQQRAELDRSLPNQLQAGALSQQATELPYVMNDSSLMQRYNNRSMVFLKEVLAAEPENETALLHYGLAVTRSPQPMQGILSLRKLTEINPQNAEAQFRLGLFSLQTQQFSKAVSRFEQVLNIVPERVEARYHLAYAKSQLDNKTEAKTLLEQVLSDKNASVELKQQAKSLFDQL